VNSKSRDERFQELRGQYILDLPEETLGTFLNSLQKALDALQDPTYHITRVSDRWEVPSTAGSRIEAGQRVQDIHQVLRDGGRYSCSCAAYYTTDVVTQLPTCVHIQIVRLEDR
jgi:hypothetical protein